MTTDDIPNIYFQTKLLEPYAGSPLRGRTRYNMTGNTITITTMKKTTVKNTEITVTKRMTSILTLRMSMIPFDTD